MAIMLPIIEGTPEKVAGRRLRMPAIGHIDAGRRPGGTKWLYVPIGLLLVAGLMLTIVLFGMVGSSKWGIMAGGISLTSLAAVYFAILVGRKAEVEQVVIKRTEELQREIVDRQQAEDMLQVKNGELLAIQKQLREVNQHLEERVTERTSAIEKLLRQKEDLITQLGHDLRSPLTPLVGLVPLLREMQSDPYSGEILDVIARNVDHMRSLVEKALRLANLSSTVDEPFDVCQVNLAKTLDELIRRRVSLFEEHGIHVENRIDGGMRVAADKARLTDVLDNLATNAVRFTPEGGKIIFEAEEQGDCAVITVQDSGIGLTELQLENIFDEFYKADQARHDLDSPGLGLSICRRIIDKLGGAIWAESGGIGRGTTIGFTIPLRIRDGAAVGSTAMGPDEQELSAFKVMTKGGAGHG